MSLARLSRPPSSEIDRPLLDVYDGYTSLGEEANTMARVHLIIPDADRDRFVHQARLEGMTLSGWLRAAAEERLKQRERLEPFTSPEEVRDFFRAYDERESGGREPDWEEHLRTLHESKMSGTGDS